MCHEQTYNHGIAINCTGFPLHSKTTPSLRNCWGTCWGTGIIGGSAARQFGRHFMALTVKQLEALTPSSKSQKLSDGKSLWGVVKVDKDDSVSVAFYWRFRHSGKHHDYFCGTWKKGVSLPSIRKERDRAAEILSTGKNPAYERQLVKEQAVLKQKEALAKIEANKAALRTVGTALEHWFKSSEILGRKDKGAYLKRAIDKDILPKLKDVPLTEVTKTMLADILHEVAARPAPVMANRLHAGLNQFFKYCCDEREWILKNPLDGTKRAKIGGKEPPRERTLCDSIDPNKHELKELLAALDKAKLQDSTKATLWIMLSTACRIGEITRASWNDIDLDEKTWTIPAENSKNGRQHIINLSDFALSHFTTLQETSGKSAWVLPASRSDGPVCVKSITKQVGDRQREVRLKGRSKSLGALRLSGGHWTPHDLRRTAATLMGHCGVLEEIIERCLNHTEESKLKRTYQRQEPRQQMREAWELLGQRIEALLAETPVTVGMFSKNKRAA